jgi:hypothetical protein
LAVISSASEPTNIGWFVALILGWLGIVIATYLIQKKYYPNLLVSATQANTRKSFRHSSAVELVPGKLGDDSFAKENSDCSMVDPEKHAYEIGQIDEDDEESKLEESSESVSISESGSNSQSSSLSHKNSANSQNSGSASKT